MRISTPWAAALTAAAVALPLLPALAPSAGAATPTAPASARPAPSFAQAEAGHRVAVRKSGLTSTTTVPGPTRAALTKAQAGLTSTREGVRASAVLSQWTVQFSGGSAEQRAAFQRAVDTWASLVDSPVPITVRVVLRAQADQDVLGSAGPSEIGVPTDVPGVVPSTFYPIALANALAGEDLNPASPDIDAEFSNDPDVFSFAEGAPPAGTYDFETVALHEIGHGLGFIGGLEAYCGARLAPRACGGGASPEAPRGGWDIATEDNAERLPFVFDRRALRAAPSPVATPFGLGQDSKALGVALTYGQTVLSGPNLTDLRPCAPVRPRLYTPNQFVPGTSYSHLDEDDYPAGTVNSLMTPFIDEQEVVRTPGPLVLAIMRDLGWKAARLPFTSALQACGPAAVTVNGIATIEGTAPVGSTVRVWFRKRGQATFSLQRTLSPSLTGRFRTAFSAVDDFAYFVTVNNAAQSPVLLTRARPTVGGPAVRRIPRGAVVTATGRGVPGTVITLRFRPPGSPGASYPLVRQTRVGADGVWRYGLRLSVGLRFFAVSGTGTPSAGTVFYQAV